MDDLECNDCVYERSLDRHVRSSHTSQPTSICDQCGKLFARSDNLQRHMRNYTGLGVATAVADATNTSAVPAPATSTIAVRPTGKLLFTLQQTRRALRGAVKQITVNMKEAKRLSTLKKASDAFKPAMVKFQQEHRAYKFLSALFFTRQLIPLL